MSLIFLIRVEETSSKGCLFVTLAKLNLLEGYLYFNVQTQAGLGVLSGRQDRQAVRYNRCILETQLHENVILSYISVI